MNLAVLIAARFFPGLSEEICKSPELTVEVLALINLLLRFKSREAIDARHN